MDHSGNGSRPEHTIDMPSNDVTFPSTSHEDNHNDLDELDGIRSPSTEPPPPSYSGATATTNFQSVSFARRDQGQRQQNPLNSGLWISIELIVSLSQIIAATSVLSVSRDEHPRAPLFEWVIGYVVGCVATIPHLFWRYLHRNIQNNNQESGTQGSSHRNISQSDSSAVDPSANSSEVVNGANSTEVPRRNVPIASPRVYALVACYKLALDCFFAVWFVVGNVWIFGGRSSVHDSPNLYRLCIVFLAFGFIGYALPFILCTMICCCLPCIISMIGFHEDLDLNRGATSEAIGALVKYKFKSMKIRDRDAGESNGGVLAAGTEKERTISAEDAVCCICLSKFSNNEDLRELPCQHVFHMECVDKWLKIKALCPLCKADLGGPKTNPDASSGDQQNNNRVEEDVESQH